MYWWQISFLLPGDLSFSCKNLFWFHRKHKLCVCICRWISHAYLGFQNQLFYQDPYLIPTFTISESQTTMLYNIHQYTMQLTDLFAASSMWHLRMICFPTNTVWLFVLSSGSMNGLPEPRIPLVTPTDLKYSGFFDWCRNLFPCSIAASLPKCLSEYLPWRAEADGSIVGSFCCQPDPVKVEICISDESSL